MEESDNRTGKLFEKLVDDFYPACDRHFKKQPA